MLMNMEMEMESHGSVALLVDPSGVAFASAVDPAEGSDAISGTFGRGGRGGGDESQHTKKWNTRS